jgi:hypothetical protein
MLHPSVITEMLTSENLKHYQSHRNRKATSAPDGYRRIQRKFRFGTNGDFADPAALTPILFTLKYKYDFQLP